MKVGLPGNKNGTQHLTNTGDTRSLAAFKCLILDDDPHDANLMSRMLSDVKTMKFNVFMARNMEEARALLRTETFDIYLIDFWMGAETTVSFVDEICSASDTALTIMLSTFDEEEFRQISKRAGAMHFISKNDLSSDALMEALSLAA